MKKTLLIISGIIFMSNTIIAQCTITESDFENWETDTIVSLTPIDIIFDTPQGWNTLFGALGAYFDDKKPGIFETVGVQSGTSCVQFLSDTVTSDTVQYGGDLFAKFACNSDPTNLYGYVNTFNLATEDTAYIMSIVTNLAGDTIGTGDQKFYGNANPQTWVIFNSQISYTASGGDSIWIWLLFMPKNSPTTKFVKIDQLSFTQPIGIEEGAILNSLNIYPNPNNGEFTVEIYDVRITNYELRVYNILGDEIIKFKIVNQKSNIDLSQYPKGIYNLQVVSDRVIFNKKVIIE